MFFLLLNNCPSLLLRTASYQGKLWAFLDILSAVVVNLGMLWSGLSKPINVSTAWMGITIIVAACTMSTLSNVHRWACDCIAQDMLFLIHKKWIDYRLWSAVLWLSCPSEMWWVVIRNVPFTPHFSLLSPLHPSFTSTKPSALFPQTNPPHLPLILHNNRKKTSIFLLMHMHSLLTH